MDTTYFGRNFGVMVFKDSITGKILFKQYVKTETNQLYLDGIKEITKRGLLSKVSSVMDVKDLFIWLIIYLFRFATFIR